MVQVQHRPSTRVYPPSKEIAPRPTKITMVRVLEKHQICACMRRIRRYASVCVCKGPADHLAAKLPPTLWGQPPARAARGCAAGGSRRLPRRHPTGSPCTWRVATLATPSAGCNQQVRAGRNGSAPIRCPGTSIHLSAVVVRVRGAGRRGLLLCINNVTTPPAS